MCIPIYSKNIPTFSNGSAFSFPNFTLDRKVQSAWHLHIVMILERGDAESKDIKQRKVKRTNFVDSGYNYLTCHNNFPFNSQSIKVYFSHYSNTVLSKLPG